MKPRADVWAAKYKCADWPIYSAWH